MTIHPDSEEHISSYQIEHNWSSVDKLHSQLTTNVKSQGLEKPVQRSTAEIHTRDG